MNNEKYNFELFESKRENIKPIRFAKSPQDIPMKDRASKPKKRSFIKRTAAFLTAGAIALGAYTLIHNHNDKLPQKIIRYDMMKLMLQYKMYFFLIK